MLSFNRQFKGDLAINGHTQQGMLYLESLTKFDNAIHAFPFSKILPYEPLDTKIKESKKICPKMFPMCIAILKFFTTQKVKHEQFNTCKKDQKQNSPIGKIVKMMTFQLK